MRDEAFRARFDGKHGVLLLTAGKRVTEEIYRHAYDTAKNFIAAQGLCSMIVDFSGVTDFQLPAGFLREIAAMAPAVPAPMRRVVVAPQAAVYGSTRIVETLRSETNAPIELFRSLAEAYASFGAVEADFADLDKS